MACTVDDAHLASYAKAASLQRLKPNDRIVVTGTANHVSSDYVGHEAVVTKVTTGGFCLDFVDTELGRGYFGQCVFTLELVERLAQE